MTRSTLLLAGLLLGSTTLVAAQTKPAAKPAAAATAAMAPAPMGVRTFKVDNSHSSVGFKVKHMGISTVNGAFGDMTATLELDPKNLRTLKTTATIQATSINTGTERRDNHLRSADFFEVEKYPEITFQSTGVTAVSGNTFKLAGNLTMHGVTKPIVLDGTFDGAMTDPSGNQRVGLTASGSLNRTEYGLTWNKAIEAGGLLVSEDVRIELQIEAMAPKPDQGK